MHRRTPNLSAIEGLIVVKWVGSILTRQWVVFHGSTAILD